MVYIQSQNVKVNSKGKHKEVRAPSTGSNMSQPRVSVGSYKNSTSNSTAATGTTQQKRYDSIEY
jgi:hypothetical protein